MVVEHVKTKVPKLGTLNLTIALIALIITLIGGIGTWLALRSEKIEVTAQILACDELTTYHPELEAEFTYGGEEVAHLWKLSVQFINSGDKTLVGEGNQANILGEGLNFVFPDGTRILRYEYGTDSFEGSIVQTNSNEFQIQFSQWRSGEYMIGSFYVASEQPLTVDPCPTASTRDIIDGDVVIQDLTEERPSERMFIIDRLPTGISMFGKIMGGIIAGLLALLATLLFGASVWSWKAAHQLGKWKKHYLTSFSEYLDQVKPPLSNKQKQVYKEKPYMVPKQLWDSFKGEKLPVKESPMFESVTWNIVFSFSSLLVAFGFVSIILALIPV